MDPEKGANFVVVHLYDPADAVCHAPVAADLKRRYPGCRLVWVADLDSAELFMDHASVNEVVVYPGRYWRKKGLIAWIRGLVYAAGRLRSMKPLKGIILRGGMEARLLLSLAGVTIVRSEPWRTGLHGHTQREEHLSFNDYGFSPSPSGLYTAQRLLSSAGLGATKPVALAPFSKTPGPGWPLSRYARLGGLIARRGIGPVIILGDEADSSAATALADAAGEGAIAMAGTGGLLVTREILRHCRAVVGSANAATLMAAAIGVPTVALTFSSEIPAAPPGMIFADAGGPGKSPTRLSAGAVLRLVLAAIGDRPRPHGPGKSRARLTQNAKHYP